MTVAVCTPRQLLMARDGGRRFVRALMVTAGLLTLTACASSGGKGGPLVDIPTVNDPAPFVSGTMRPYTIRGRTYRPVEQPNYDETGMASWYGQYHHGKSTSTGERFDMNALTAAHKTLPLPSMVEVTNPANGRRVLLRVNDRGPFVDNRIIDLSRGAAEALGLLQQGVGEVRVRYAGRAPRSGGGARLADVGTRGASQPAASVPVAPAPRSSTERPYNEVVRQPPAQSAPSRPRTQSPRRGYEGVPTVRNVPIPEQPLPPVMPSRDPLPAPVVPAPIPAPVPVPVPTPTPAPYAPPVQEPVSPYATPVQPLPPPVPAPSPQTAPVSPYAPPVAQPQSQPVYPPATVPAPTYPGTPEGYRVQVSVFEQPAFANAVARQLGGGATVESFERNGRTLYRVVVGPWPDHAAAERSRQAIIARGFGDALLIAD
ncbi:MULTISPECIES: septal ring lytic transglycosylase RlpA family protein [unclassified Brevundimonas]|uniref:septal ring lytic transglycosylase RlpA family protein n=1 Tax=unclassified Brevundimonas TaxID=2622653 RepID=UPI0028A5BB76|nr:septal ring lytic transglycosylase RlpA family protein [Brevundimonas sp.]